jgi:hypothetical protein
MILYLQGNSHRFRGDVSISNRYEAPADFASNEILAAHNGKGRND